jgi:polyhydroxyalkanoate synthesis repressor PhaR
MEKNGSSLFKIEGEFLMKRVIRKYSNRKLYDVTSSKMITLKDIADFIKEGYDVKVIEHETGEDVTELTLAQIILEQVKGKREILSVPVLLRELIKSGRSSIAEFIKHSILASIEAIALTEKKAKELVRNLIDTGRISESEGRELLEILIQSVKERSVALEERIKKIALDVIEEMGIPSKKTLEDKVRTVSREVLKSIGIENEEALEEKIEGAVRSIIKEYFPTGRELDELRKDLEEIKLKLDLLIKELEKGR